MSRVPVRGGFVTTTGGFVGMPDSSEAAPC